MERVAWPRRARAPDHLGARVVEGGVEFAAFARHASWIAVCLFDSAGRETARWRLGGRDGDVHCGFVPAIGAGARYGLRVDGPHDRAQGHWFDPAKLLIDPYATRLDAPVVWRAELAAPRAAAIDTAPFMPRAVVPATRPPVERHAPTRPTFIYEVAVKAFTRHHPDAPVPLRGTLAGLAHPRVAERIAALGVSHVELMPIAAHMSERHLVETGLENAWGYNPAAFMALDPRLAPEAMEDLRDAVACLREAGVGALLDVVFNHTAEGDALGPTLSLRGLDNASYYRLGEGGALVNDTGCGNTLACERPHVAGLIVDALRYFVEHAGVDGFRFDLAATLARDDAGFPQPHPLFEAIAAEPALRGKTMIAEPWDIGPGGYRLGAFPSGWLEWNDRYRDAARRFWRGEGGAIGDFATRLCGSADVFAATRDAPSASVNFLAAHDGFSLRDLVSYEAKRNLPNGEDNRDGSNENHSWNCGLEGETTDETARAARARDIRALLACLFVARGTPMLTAGDEFGRTQGGNNNAYAQDNATTWLDWAAADANLASFVGRLANLRRSLAPLAEDRFLTGLPTAGGTLPDVLWTLPSGAAPTDADWRDADMLCATLCAAGQRLFIACNRAGEAAPATPPAARQSFRWGVALDSSGGVVDPDARMEPDWRGDATLVPARCVLALLERPALL